MKSCRLNFLESRRHLPIDYLPKSQINSTYYYLSLLLKLRGYFEGKMRREFVEVTLYLHDYAPAHRAIASKKKLEYLCFQIHDHSPYSPDLALSENHLLPRPKKNFKVAIFRPTWKTLLPRRPGWTENFLNFFSVLHEIEHWAEKRTERRGIYGI